MSQLAAYLSGLDWSPLLISLKTGIVATIISFFLGIYAARKVVKAGPRVKIGRASCRERVSSPV